MFPLGRFGWGHGGLATAFILGAAGCLLRSTDMAEDQILHLMDLRKTFLFRAPVLSILNHFQGLLVSNLG
jgi:hypothetical protein